MAGWRTKEGGPALRASMFIYQSDRGGLRETCPPPPHPSTVYLLLQVLAFVARARAQGVAVELSVAPGMVHVFPLFVPFGPSGREPANAMGRAAAFLDRVLGVAAAGQPLVRTGRALIWRLLLKRSWKYLKPGETD